MKNIIDLTDKKILVTGASSGMGRETAILCSQLGAKLILLARREDKLVETINELEGIGHRYYTFDLSNIEEIEDFIKKVISENGPLDGFVQSAGLAGTRPLKNLKPAFLNEIMAVNFCSFVEIVRCITKKRCFNEGMSIVEISSISAIQGNQGKIAYCSSKAAVDSSVRCMGKELLPKKVRINTVNPGWIRTQIYDEMIKNNGDSTDFQMTLARQYMGLGEPIDVANMIVYLLSDAAKFITGSNIVLDGGRLSS